MIAHVILFTPRAELPDAARQDLLADLATAAATIPSVRRFRVGARVKHGLPGYEQVMATNYAYAAIIEFDDLDGLKAYLAHRLTTPSAGTSRRQLNGRSPTTTSSTTSP